MIYHNGLKLTADSFEELEVFARKVNIGFRSWREIDGKCFYLISSHFYGEEIAGHKSVTEIDLEKFNIHAERVCKEYREEAGNDN